MTHSNHYYFTSESVSEGHPDKICDRISDEILDYCLRKDPEARCAVEVLATTNHVTIAGEVRGNGITDKHFVKPEVKQDICKLVRKAVKDIGYEQKGFHHEHLDINFRLHTQSEEIAGGVDANAENDKDEGAGDQGIMFGYATNELEKLGIPDHEYMPAAIYFSHKILKKLSALRKTDDLFGPDMKSQVTLIYNQHHEIIGVDNIVLSTQHVKKYNKKTKDFKKDTFNKDIRSKIEKVVINVLSKLNNIKILDVTDEKKLRVNPAGDFVIGGPDGDAGLTGRKIIVDTYGGACPHGGGAFSGKDPTKVDRSAAYMARYLAKNIVAANLANTCEIQLSYAIGDSDPKSVFVKTDKGQETDRKLEQAIRKIAGLDKQETNKGMLSPEGIRTHLKLNNPIYVETSSYGHFGHKPKSQVDKITGKAYNFFTWEDLTLINVLKQNI